MKRTLLIIMEVIALSIALMTAPVFAGGDQVRGEKGTGEVNQEQVQDPPPFQL